MPILSDAYRSRCCPSGRGRDVQGQSGLQRRQLCKDTAWAILVAFAFRFFPIVSGLGSVAFLALLVAVPAMAIRWWVKFSGISTDDPEFRRAKRTVAAIGIPITIVLLAVVVLLAVGIASIPGRR